METKAAQGSAGLAERWALLVVIWLVPVVGVILGTKRWLPPLASAHGAGIDRMLRYLLISVGGLFVVGNVVLGYFIWRFSRGGPPTYRLASPKVERRWSLVPVVVMTLIAEGGVFALGLPVWRNFYAAAPPPNSLVVEVTAEQFAWNVRYPGEDGTFGRTEPRLISLDNPLGLDKSDPAARDDIVLLGRVHLQIDRPARIRLRSKDVIHSFFLPNFRVKQDAVPGMTIDIWFVPTKLGTYEIACAQHCGFGHFQMRGVLQVMSAEDFDRWMKEQATYF